MIKRGQSAMEFLMTYGWAILAAIIAIGALAYFGVFSPGRSVTGNAILNAPFYVNSYAINTTDIYLDVRNGYPESVTLSNLTLNNLPSGVTCSGPDATPVPLVISADSSSQIEFGCTGLNPGDSIKADIALTYTKGDSMLPAQATGNIVGSVA